MTPAIRITVAATAGSTPREAGAAMLVREDGIEGTIGGGALEWQAMAEARRMLAMGVTDARRVYPLGPALGQCCGGSVTLDFALADSLPEPEGRPVWIWGAGHVGRAIVAVAAPLPGLAITWVDIDMARFPDPLPPGVRPLVAVDPVRAVRHAPGDARHLILTHSHEIDLALCHALLGHGFDTLGLIGSATKRARFASRLGASGHDAAAIARIACPIGDPALGKHPQAIALGVAADLIRPGARGA